MQKSGAHARLIFACGIMKDNNTSHASPSDAVTPRALQLPDALVFLARFFGTQVPSERVRDMAQAQSGHRPHDAEHMRQLLAHAGLSGTALGSAMPRATELPALLLGGAGECMVVLALRHGQAECHQPGIDGTHWLDIDTLERAIPGGHWLAVRPQLHFDERSLLYTLPRAGRWFWDTFARNRWMLGWALAGTVTLNIFGALVPFYSMAVYDRVIPHNALGSLWVLTSAALLITGFEFVMRLLRSHLLESAARRMDVAMSSQVFAQCLRMRSIDRPASGGVLANTVRDFESVREFFSTGTLTVLGDMPFTVLYLVVIALVGGPLVIVPLACLPLLLGVSLASRKPLALKVGEAMQESTQRTAHLFETMNGLDTVKAIGAEAWSRRKWESLTQAIAHNNMETREITARTGYLNASILALANVAVVAAGAYLASRHALSMGQIIAVSLLSGRALAPVGQLAALVLRWEQTRLSLQAIDKIMAAPGDEIGAPLQAPPISGMVEFRDLGFGFAGQPPVLERLNLRIRAGERVGIIGKLGSGKSTLLKLILNQYAPGTGSVRVDDLVTTQLDPLSLRRQIGYVPQDAVLFHGSLRENIEIGRVQADDEALLNAMRTACLDEIVAQLPQGVGTPVGERGERLSGGQRQLVAIARALLASPKLLLLDEPSSMVDPATEQKLIERLRSLHGTTQVLVTHRMAMLALVERLIVLERGRIVADGPRDEVLQALAQRPAARPAKAEGAASSALAARA